MCACVSPASSAVARELNGSSKALCGRGRGGIEPVHAQLKRPCLPLSAGTSKWISKPRQSSEADFASAAWRRPWRCRPKAW